MSSDDAFLQRLRATFREEAEEHLHTMTTGLLQLEREDAPPRRKELIEEVFRAAHSLKGAARAVEFRDVESACQSLEDIFAAWKRQESQPAPALLDQIHVRVTRLAALVGAPGYDSTLPQWTPATLTGGPQAAAAPRPRRPAPRPSAGSGPEPEPTPPAAIPSVRLSVDVLDARLLEAEEMLAAKLAAAQRVEDLRELRQHLKRWRGDLAAAADEGAPERLQVLERKVSTLLRSADDDRAALAKLADEVVASSRKLLLMPFATVAAPLPWVVRDLCRAQGKEVDLRIEGEEIVLDKHTLDMLKDPLIHLLRNCIDHGIEAPSERVRRGKPSRAQVNLALTQVAGGRVRLTLADDGRGIDTTRVKACAVRQGAVATAEAAAMSDAQAQALIFRSGISTSPAVTELSGRGLGLAIVQERAARLGGEVEVESKPGAGTTFRITVPALRETFRGILVEVSGRLLVLPTMQVERATRVRADAIRRVGGRHTLLLGGRIIPVVRLALVLEIEDVPPAAAASGIPMLIVAGGGERVAFAVDQVLDEQEFLVKPLQRPLVRVRNVASATVLSTGNIALILNTVDLLQSARHAPAAPPRSFTAPTAPTAAPAPHLLVAEDSITSRLLIRGILETAGYRVTTALDGMDALERLRTGAFDLLVSDIEMPRLNGFDLTARIRTDPKLAALPVVLVTSLDAREDRERGMDVGASAYIVKSSVEHSTLVDAIRQLV